MYPNSLNKDAMEDELNISFRPTQNYASLAEATVGTRTSWMNNMQVRKVHEMRETLAQPECRDRICTKNDGQST
ncbi:hypothetical protein HBI56_216040 [Parastagonospora nodorum]|nr:hypothetical protein HBH56_176420 [Parastagonospora nodorum]KAH3926494.1 hypothetical protein HBH54_166740 [Parastagonospora nodorum]KAH3939085.1 hypothetical protein HBH53_240180 [Parastagonospora nodorum]KAH3965615.1 hypothetical protein HBH52_203380 [Parastagonospora nodorum]KAH3971464.1 hypothetical protein HBH51_109110 [Parastagonospora nodorum]